MIHTRAAREAAKLLEASHLEWEKIADPGTSFAVSMAARIAAGNVTVAKEVLKMVANQHSGMPACLHTCAYTSLWKRRYRSLHEGLCHMPTYLSTPGKASACGNGWHHIWRITIHMSIDMTTCMSV